MSVTDEEMQALAALDELDAGNMPDEDEEAMDDGELNTVIDTELSNSHGHEDSDLAGDRETALNYYFNRARGDEGRFPDPQRRYAGV